MFHSSLLLSLALGSFAAAKPCAILGPVFEAPTGLADSSVLQDALSSLQEVLDNITTTGVTPLGPLAASNNSFAIGIFDTSSPDELFSYQFSSTALKQSTQGVTAVTDSSIFRIGSLSKLITAYTFLIEAGPKHWDQPVTKYIPELKTAAKKCSATDGPIDCTDWDDITLGALASHLAGVPRDYSTPAELLDPLTLGFEKPVAIGLPPLPESALPPCGLGPTDACTKKQYLDGFTAASPLYAPFTTPIYSNGGYALLAMALENITGRSMSDMVDDVFQKLNMTQSTYENPASLDGAVVPLGVSSGYQAILGVLAPAGGYFSTQADIAKLGRSILMSTQLKPSDTRDWMKPSSFIESSTGAVGKPWEIFRVPDLVNDHGFDLYTKTGDVLAYSSHLILSPAHNVGITILAAGNDTTTTREVLAEIVTAALFPAVEKAARSQAEETYAGTYKSTDAAVDTEIILTTQRGRPGLFVKKWIVNGTDTLEQLYPETEQRLYPTDLVQTTPESSYKISYRMVSDPVGLDLPPTIYDPGCQSWFMVGGRRYGGVALDQVVFTVEDGKATTMSPRAWRTTLEKTD